MDQAGDDVALLGREAQPLQRRPRYVRTDILVAEERAVALGGLRLAGVVEQSRDPQQQLGRSPLDRQDGVPKHIVRVVARLRHALARGDLGQDHLQELGVVEQPEGAARPRRDEHFAQLVGDAFDGDNGGC